MRRAWLAAALTAALLLTAACQTTLPQGESTRIAFGSCNRSDLPQPLWSPILESGPDLWIWVGDNVYGDTEDMNVLAGKYRAQLENPGYRELLSQVPVIGTWDDHDFGANDAGAEYPMKAASQQLLLDFLAVPRDDPRRGRAGVYSSYVLGQVPRQVKIYLLDVRYHREPPGPEGDILGEEQWLWLARELQASTAQLNLIVSGTQVLPADHQWERWSAYPRARQRLLDLVVASRLPGIVFLSGDRHFAELTRVQPDNFYPLFEVTSSGLTHFWEELESESNRARQGRLYKGLNFGLIEVLWDAARGPRLRLQVRDDNARPRVRIEFPLARLSVAD